MANLKKLLKEQKIGKITYDDNILQDIISIAISEIEHVKLGYPENSLTKKSVFVDNYSEKGAKIEVFVKIHYNQNIPEIAFKIQETIKYSLEFFNDNKVDYVNVNVIGVYFDNETTQQENNYDDILDVADIEDKPKKKAKNKENSNKKD